MFSQNPSEIPLVNVKETIQWFDQDLFFKLILLRHNLHTYNIPTLYIFMSFDTFIHPHSHHYIQNIEHLYHPRKLPFAPSQSVPCLSRLHRDPRQLLICFLSFLKFRINWIIHVYSLLCLPPLTHYKVSSSFLFINIPWYIYHSSCVQLPVEKHLRLKLLWTFVNKSLCRHTYVSLVSGNYEVGLISSVVSGLTL